MTVRLVFSNVCVENKSEPYTTLFLENLKFELNFHVEDISFPFLFFKNYTVQRRHPQHARTLTPEHTYATTTAFRWIGIPAHVSIDCYEFGYKIFLYLSSSYENVQFF
jgi:hypothetical protein